MTTFDVVVAGAGHNSLVCAAYLARAGMKVLVLERAERIGGDTCTEEVTLPGFRHDMCASAHTVFQSSPIVRNDELSLGAYGLRYLFPEPAAVMPFLDGRSITMFRDPRATVREIARFSEHDARAYEQLLADWDAIKGVSAQARYAPATAPSAQIADLERTSAGLEAVRWRYSSAVDIVRERFADEHVRSFFLWLALMTMANVDQPGTGLNALSLPAGRQAFSWTTAEGGSVALPDALARIVVEHGGEVRTGSEVTRVIVEGGRAVGVTTADGAEHRARRAVVSTIHIKHLAAVVGREHLGDEFLAGVDRWRTGVTMFVTHYALDAAPRYRTEQGPVASVGAGICATTDELLDALVAFRRGEVRVERPPLLAINASAVDPTRAPAGKHTLKLVGFLPYDLRDGGPERWDSIKQGVSEALFDHYLRHVDGLTRANVLATHVESPLDLERRNPHNYRGSCHGGDQDLAQDGALRPVPGHAAYRLPLPGLYQTGATTHPGGSVTGAPGRNCAQVVMQDLGLSFIDALAPRQPAAAR
ncbi:MAG TPA: NAD(P)/FAD-dependent oxidoreductase [Candidatus Limnocylindria bacterium]